MEARVGTAMTWLRAALVGSMFVIVGAVGHVSADGLLPGAVAMTMLLAVSVVLAGPFLVRAASRLRLVLLLVGGQFVVHLVLSISGGHRGDERLAAGTAGLIAPPQQPSLPTVDGQRVGSLFDAAQVATGSTPASVPGLSLGHLVDDLAAHAPMMAAHVAAAAVVGLWLAHGEKTLWTLLSLTARRVLVACRLFLPVPSTGSFEISRALLLDVPFVSVWDASPTSVRGPPVLTTC